MKRRTVEIQVSYFNGPLETLTVYPYGRFLGIHKSTRKPVSWVIWHIPTGRYVCTEKSFRLIQQIARRLASECDWDFDKPDSPKVAALSPRVNGIVAEIVFPSALPHEEGVRVIGPRTTLMHT